MLFKEALSVGVTPFSRILVLFCGKIDLIFFLSLRIGIVHPNKNDIDGALRTSGPISIVIMLMGECPINTRSSNSLVSRSLLMKGYLK